MLDLRAAVLPVHAPLAEVLAVVCPQAIAVFSETRAGAPNYLFTPQGIAPCGPDPNRIPAGESRQRDLFHRAPVPVISQGGIVNDISATDVDAVVRVAKARGNEVGAQPRFLVRCQASIASHN